jgi:hypothetical protein
MKTYRVARPFLWRMAGTKVFLTAVAVHSYLFAVTHPTPFVFRVLLLIGLATFGWLMYLRVPKMPREISVTDDGWVDFRGREGIVRVQAADIRSIGQGLGRGLVRVRHAGGKLWMFNRFQDFYDFLSTVKTLNPAIQVKGF